MLYYYSTLLYYTIMLYYYSTTLYYTTLYYTILYYTILYYAVTLPGAPQEVQLEGAPRPKREVAVGRGEDDSKAANKLIMQS